jgi:hypothetical protein
MPSIFEHIPEGWNGDVVVLWGWFAAQDRHVHKYAEMHATSGRASVRVTADESAVMLKLSRPLSWCARKSLERGEALRRQQKGGNLLVHLFSNGGAFLYERVLLDRASFPQIDGVIFDSAPAYMHPRTGLDVIQTHTRPAVLRPLLGCVFGSLTGLMFVISKRGDDPADRYWRTLMEDASRTSALYVYSHEDTTTDAQALELLIKHRIARGDTRIATLVMPDSGHVLHMRTHPEEYTLAVDKFVQSCVRS